MKKLLALLFFAAPALALAHPGHESSGLMAGLWHPIGGWDHLLAMLAVGLWAASFSGKARWLIPASFVGVMALGFVFGANGGEMPMMEQGIAASVLVLGLAAAWVEAHSRCFCSRLWQACLRCFTAWRTAQNWAAHGALSFTAGFMIATAALHAAGFGIGQALNKNVWLLRATGSAIAGLGMLFGRLGYCLLFA
jgi:urease accessory protein